MSESKSPFTPISSLGEFKLIDRIVEGFECVHPSTIKGIGDDSAVVHTSQHQVITTDLLTEGIHFDLMYSPLKHLGYKAVVVNLSDIYAMNARPKQILVSLALSNRFSVEAVDELYEGVRAACKKYNVDLIGGDTTSSPKGLTISITAIGEAPYEKIVFRNTAKEGDLLVVSGDLGAAYIGLQLLEREKQIFLENPSIQIDLKGHDYTVGRQLKPEARMDIVEILEKMDIVPTSMIDISDGLSSEILHLCKQSNVGCVLHEEFVPIDQNTYNTALSFNIDPINCALSGGEDYELLFTIHPKDAEKIKNHPDMSIIGEITDVNLGIKLHSKGDNYYDLISMGWDNLDVEK
ncbi:MAG: thiamine-phosphate kinase [Chitinophagales bacterium]|nr:thiamine-phosphate kinase [Chitinophagales bacterium]